MALTTEQRATLAQYIAADPALSSYPHNSDGAWQIALELQSAASPAVVVWRTSVSKDEIMQNGFDWVEVDNLTVGKARIWEWLFDNGASVINPSKANVRAGIAECWKGTAAKLAVQSAVFGHCKRNANRLEALFAVGSGTTESPATMTIEGSISYAEIVAAMGW